MKRIVPLRVGGIALALLTTLNCGAGDLLRTGTAGGARAGGAPASTAAPVTVPTAATAGDMLARTTMALQAVQAMQAAARSLAIAGANNLGADPNHAGLTLPTVPNGLALGGLQVAPGVPANLAQPGAGENAALWQGAGLPSQTVASGTTTVTIVQTAQEAVLNWKTFNLGKNTTLAFDQSAGGANVSEWIAFNKVTDPTGVPSQILGSISAAGQVYVINPNGIIFGGSSQVNVHTLVASSLPINDNLIAAGLLNNPDDQFLFTAIALGAGANGTPAFTPAVAATPDGANGAVTVQAGATLTSPASAESVGGLIALIGPGVSNAGTISTPDGQTILAAGRQVGLAAHASTDPSLRGLDVFVGQGGGAATNTGVGAISAPRGAVTLTGAIVSQLGVIDSSTSVSFNGRIDLLASYDAVSGGGVSGLPAFFPRTTGLVTLGAGSITRILPELAATDRIVGTTLALPSQINLQGRAIDFASNALLLAPSARVAIAAGNWSYTGAGAGAQDQFVFTGGQIYLDTGARIDVSGSQAVPADISENVVAVQLLGTELADSPLQRNGPLFGQTIQIDVRQSGVYNGQAWVGTPLANTAGYVGLIQRSVGELTVGGGSVSLQAGNSVVVQPGAGINVSGGWINYAGGAVNTTQLVSGGQLVDIAQATPDRVYQGIYSPTSSSSSAKWGVVLTNTNPQLSSGYEAGYVQGGNGGSLTITAPAVALDGNFAGTTVAGPYQRSAPPVASAFALFFQGQDPALAVNNYPLYSPTPPAIVFAAAAPAQGAVGAFGLDAVGNPLPLRADRQASVVLSPDLVNADGFGNFKVVDSDGAITVPAAVTLKTAPGGSISLVGANLDIEGRLVAPGGSLSLEADTISPYVNRALTGGVLPVTPSPNPGRGVFTLGGTAALDVSGLLVDDGPNASAPASLPFLTAGGSVAVKAYTAKLAAGSSIDAAGGLSVSATNKLGYGAGGAIAIAAGQDPNIASVLGGQLMLESTLRGYSGGQGASLSLLAPQIQIGGTAANASTLLLAPAFFSQGGFASFALTGLGAPISAAGQYAPALTIAPGTLLAPAVSSWLAQPDATGAADFVLAPALLPLGLRPAVSLSFNAAGVRDPYNSANPLVVRGDFVLGAGAVVSTEPKGKVAIAGDTVAVLGTVRAPGGAITITGGKDSNVLFQNSSAAVPTVDLGPASLLSAAGAAVLTPDPRGYRSGSVLPGGSIAVSGNIVAEAGSVLDVSGAAATLDLAPSYATTAADGSTGGALRVPTQVASSGGSIRLAGAQELFSDATLKAAAGGAAVVGGSVTLSSGRFYPLGASSNTQTPLDITLTVSQSAPAIPAPFYGAGQTAIGHPVADGLGTLISGGGHVVVDDFVGGGFHAVALNGTVQFVGAVNLASHGSLTVGTGGVIYGNGAVTLTAPYVDLGTPFGAPLAPLQPTNAFSVQDQPYYFSPAYGPGSLTVSASLIDLGNLSLQNIGQANLIAANGDIRGDGTLDVAGAISLTAGQIYPPTAVAFTIAASDYTLNGAAHAGSIAIVGSGSRQLPLSAGGDLNLYGSTITQGGVLVAPYGSINLGWNGSGTAPTDAITGKAVIPAQQLTLAAGSLTSVSAVNAVTGQTETTPYGLNLNGTAWIDPTGTDITEVGPPNKAITFSAAAINDQAGATVDLAGGGDLYAYRFVPGIGGSTDVLAASSSFAVVPGYQAAYAPYGAYNSNPLTTNLGGDAGYVNAQLGVGDRIYLAGGAGLAAGFYTLLPARYALLPGAFLVTPKTGTPPSAEAVQPNGASLVAGYRLAGLDAAQTGKPLSSAFIVSPAAVVRAQAQYDDSSANQFLAQSGASAAAPRLPIDAGQLVLAATKGMTLTGSVLAQAPAGGRGGLIDISSPDSILIAAPGTTAPAGTLVLSATALSAFGAESLLIGGVRHFDADGTRVTVDTDTLTVDNRGAPLTGSDIILAANHILNIAAGADIEQTKTLVDQPDNLVLGSAQTAGSGDGALVRVSGAASAGFGRVGVDASAGTALTVGAGATLAGATVALDSTGATMLDPSVALRGTTIDLGSGQIALALGATAAAPPAGDLVLSGAALQSLQSAHSLSLLSYTSIDIYGSGQVGALNASSQPILGQLALHAAEIRGFGQGGGAATFIAGDILLDNSAAGAASGLGPTGAGSLVFNAATIELGANPLRIDQFAGVALNASTDIRGQGTGGLTVQGNLALNAPLLTAATAASQAITATGALTLQAPTAGAASSLTGGLDASLALTGASITDNTAIILPAGALTLHATSGDVTVGNAASARLDVGGSALSTFDQVNYIDGGQVTLAADGGSVILGSGAAVNVSAAAGGGNAGSLSVSTPAGSLTLAGSLTGQAGSGGGAGTFALDAGRLPAGSTAALDTVLNAGGFTLSRALRIRTGDLAVDGTAIASHYNLSADQGSITVTGTIDASGITGGTIGLEAGGSVTLAAGSRLTVAGQTFDAAGHGGTVSLEAGAETQGMHSSSAVVDIRTGATIDLSVASATAASAGLGDFTGTLHLRAPQNAAQTDLSINPINGTIVGASAIRAEGYQVFDLTGSGGAISSTVEAAVLADGNAFAANTAAISSRLLAGQGGAGGALGALLQIVPGAEIINTTGDLTLNSAWDLSSYRFGPNQKAAGVLTLRAAGNLIFAYRAAVGGAAASFGSLSDGFGGASSNGLWDAPLLAAGSSSWSYRLVAGADFGAADFSRVQPLGQLGATSGSIVVGADSPALPIPSNPNGLNNPSALRQNIVPNFFEVIRTGTGDIDLAAGRDILLLNPLATIYTAGTQAAALGNFDVPTLSTPIRNSKLGPVQNPVYGAQYSLGGGNVTLTAQRDIAHDLENGSLADLLPDSSKELPTNWLYRRGSVDPATGLFAVTATGEVQSTSWWIDYSNFFEGVGALGGGNVTLSAGRDVSNVDAVVPTNARMPKGAPAAAGLLELGGGNLLVRAGHDIDGGVYYVERGNGTLSAGGSITTNVTRAALTEADVISLDASGGAPDPSTWLPTTLFLGKGRFTLTAGGDLLLGPVANPFLLPQGVNNSAYEKSYFSTYAASDGVTATSLTGDLTLRDSANGGAGSLADWEQNVLLYDPSHHQTYASYSQPWLQSLETSVAPFLIVEGLMPPSLKATALSGDVRVVGDLTLAPSALGTVDFAAAGSIDGFQVNAFNSSDGNNVWASAQINLSDADPNRLPGVASPLALSVAAAASPSVTPIDLLASLNQIFAVSGSITGIYGVSETKQALHAAGPLHLNDPNPVRLYAVKGSISGLTLFAPKATRVMAGLDITDVAFYLQNVSTANISLVEAGRDLIAYDPNSSLRVQAQTSGNELLVTGDATPQPATGNPTAGDIQIGGPGTLEVLAGRNLTMGIGPNAADGTAVGVTSIGNTANPSLPFAGADVIGAAGLGTRLSLLDAAVLDAFFLTLRDTARNRSNPASPGFGTYDTGFAAIAALFPGTLWQGDISLASREIKTESGGDITLLAPGGSLTVGVDLAGNQPIDQGILTEDGGNISIFTRDSVNVGTSRIFTLRGGNEILWASLGNIAAGASSKTVQSAPPTRVLIDPQSADVKVDLAGLATGGGIGVLATVAGVPPGDVDLIAPSGTIDAGQAGIRVSGNLNISALHVVNTANISVSGASVGVPTVVAPSLGGLAGAAASATAAGSNAAGETIGRQERAAAPLGDLPSMITVEVLGYGGGD